MSMRGFWFLAFVIFVVIPIGVPLVVTDDWRDALCATFWVYVILAAIVGIIALAAWL